MKARASLLLLFFGLISSLPVYAHHSFAAEFDANKPITIKGVVSKVEWTNPHVYFYLDVKDQTGNVTTWGFEGGNPGQLDRSGWTHDSLKVGDVVEVDGFAAKDGAHLVGARRVTLADGRKLRGGSGAPGDENPRDQN